MKYYAVIDTNVLVSVQIAEIKLKTIQSFVRTAVHSLQKLQLWFLPIIITIMRELNLLLVALRTENHRLMGALRKEVLYPPLFFH